ncbi:MAG TPA: DUF1501 domain-containing protein, partial [Planctomycetaceae bacterium]|nr:DUF1501 domain-containing protein [Planctomycetaceae bacterium]
MHRTRYCDGVARRDVLRVGLAGLVGGGLPLSRLLAGEAADRSKEDVSVIILFLKGGLSTIDTFDLKPQAPAEFRGEFSPIDTNVPGMQIGEHLPLLSRVADRFSLVRSFGHKDSNHGPADHYMLTGYYPTAGFNPSLSPNNQKPAFGSIIAKKLGPRGAVPPYVCVPRMHPSAGSAYLGASAAPFVVEADPSAPNFAVPDLAPPLEIAADRLERRQELLGTVDRFRRTAELRANRSARTVSQFQQQAFELMTSAATRKAFDIAQEPDALRDAYGRNPLGQSCLMARRLVEAGVRCVTIDHTNWDTHDNNFATLKNDLLPILDPGLTMLLRDLADRGRLDKTLVIVTGEFGRTPRINQN